MHKGHHTGTNQVFINNGRVPSSVPAIVGVIKSTVRHGVGLQGSYLVKRENDMGQPEDKPHPSHYLYA